MTSRGRLIEVLRSYRLFWGICGGLLVVNVLFYVFFVASEARETARLQSRVQTEREKVSEMRKRQADIERFRALQAAWEDFEGSLPAKIQFPERIQQLKQLLNRYQLRVEDLAFRSEPLEDTNLVRFTTRFQTTGAYEAVKRFIGELQTMAGLFCIQALELQKPETDNQLEMTMQLSAYFRNTTTAAMP